MVSRDPARVYNRNTILKICKKMLYNEHYQDDIIYITQVTRNVLLTLGVWPSFNRSFGKRVSKFLVIFASYALLYCVLIPATLFWLIEKRTRVKIQLFPVLLYGLMTISKYGNLIFRQGQIKRCLEHIEQDWKSINSMDTRDIMIESAKTGRRLAALCGVFSYGGGLTFRAILPFAKGKIINAQNITIKPLPCPGYFFSLDVQATPTYEIIFAVQIISGLVTYTIATGACGLAAVFVMHACGQLRILIDLLTQLVEDTQWQDEQEIDRKLADVVEHQTRIRNFLRLVEQTMQQICLIEIMGNTIMVCIFGYCLIMEWENSNTTAMCSYFISILPGMINMFLFCYTGEQLTAQAEKVAITSCELEWYRLPDKKARGIVLVMMMSNLPTKITAGKIIDLSFKTYGDVVKTAVTYLNMLRNVTD